MTSKEKKKKAGHWKMTVHEYYKSRCIEYSVLSFTEQMRICNYLYSKNCLRYRTQEELDKLVAEYLEINHYLEITRFTEDFYGKAEL